MIAEAGDIFSIIVADIVLSGDNALIIGMAAASLPPEMRKKGNILWHGGRSLAAHCLCRYCYQASGHTGVALRRGLTPVLGLLAAIL